MNIKVLQWNIWFLENVDAIIDEIKRFQVDVVTAQELILHSAKNINTARYIANSLGFNYFYYTADTWSGKESKEAQGNAIFSRFPIVSTQQIHLRPPKHNPANAFQEGRVYIEATIDIKGKQLEFGTTHLTFTPDFEITPPRKTETDNLIEIIKHKQSSFIFGGDLNAAPSSYVIKELEKYLHHTGPNYDQKTFANQPFNYRGIYQVEGLEWRLDYLFASHDIDVNRAQIMKTKYSDHLPILVEIEI